MGVPKFFRWLSERYPLINQPINCPPNDDTKKSHGFHPGNSLPMMKDNRKNTALPHIMPEFDRLYLDMNGIIHCASHNNSEEELEKEKVNGSAVVDGSSSTDAELRTSSSS